MVGEKSVALEATEGVSWLSLSLEEVGELTGLGMGNRLCGCMSGWGSSSGTRSGWS